MIYNTLTREKEELRTIEDGKVRMYVCGPTVYDHSHIGHARSYVSFDVIRRFLEYRGYKVKYVSNFTDVDDKIINRANETGEDPLELARKFTESFFEDMDALGVRRADVHPKVTETIPEIIDMVKSLVEKGNAYVTDRGNVYFDLRSAENLIGVLSHQTLDALLEGSGDRVELEDDKRFPLDFALWKASKEGEPAWESPWGSGRPGWHIECSVMSMKHLGDQIDVHGGGMDLVFPHHESEILQSECATGKSPFARYWIHNGFLTIDREKMSKSLGNFFTIKEVLEKFRPEVVRFYLVNSHYRRPIDFSDVHLEEAGTALERLVTARRNLKFALDGAPDSGDDGGFPAAAEGAREAFIRAMEDDFNCREAVAVLYEFGRKTNEVLNKGTPSRAAVEEALGFFDEAGSVLGLFLEEKEAILDDEIEALIKEREEARASKDFARADSIRDKLASMGIVLEDTKDGVRWRRA